MYRDKIKINDDKTEFLVIGSRQQLLKIHHCSVHVGTIDIKPVKVARNLSACLFACLQEGKNNRKNIKLCGPKSVSGHLNYRKSFTGSH